MALLAFDDCSNSPVGSLLDHAQRQKTASELNAAILAAQYQEKGRSGHYCFVHSNCYYDESHVSFV